MNKRILTLAALLAVAFSLNAQNAQADARATKAKADNNKTEAVKTVDRANEPVRVVYHVNEGNDQATQALRNIRNHLEADPTAKIVVVTHANGIDFLLDGAADKNGNNFEANVQELKGKGVDFRVCAITLKRRNIDLKKVIDEAVIVPSGVAEVAKLQFKEGYAYLRP